MQTLLKVYEKNDRLVLGLMSGTSLDGIDIALVKITGNGTNTKLKLIAYKEFPFPEGFKDYVLLNSLTKSSNVTDICKINFLVPRIYANAIEQFCTEFGISKSDIDLIGTHGQTIHHLPKKETMFDFSTASTLQVGDPSVLAKLTGILTVGDFRPADIALGGEGAPLVPYFDYIMFSSPTYNRALLNIGGISNFTILKKNCTSNDIFAFDTGPGNMLIDYLMKQNYNVLYDNNGQMAQKGKLIEPLLDELEKNDIYLNRTPPKSTGREYYNEEYLQPIIQNVKSKFNNITIEDIIHTVTYYTAYTIFKNYQKFVMPTVQIDELFVSGGGAKNPVIMKYLQQLFGKNTIVKNCDSLSITSDSKEAVCFAVLANETISGNPSNVPNVTGASKLTILGKICLP
ncbi:MAG: anhydro-N-acetylmuramic acid kinase [bacterium]